MNKLLTLLLIVPILGMSQDYEIANWFNFKRGAVCLTFDDGTLDHPNNVIPALDSKGIPGTFFINKMGSYSWAINAILNGHEIANHTAGHPHLTSIDTSLLKFEITDFQKTLADALGKPVTTIAYPYGEGGEVTSTVHYVQDTVAKTHIGARAVTQPINDSAYFYDFYQNERAYYQVNTIHMRNSMLGYDSTFQKVVNYGGLMTYMFHSVGTVGGFDYIGLKEFDTFLATLKGRESEIWISTFGQAIKYHREKKGAVLSTSSVPFANGNTWVLNLTDDLPDSIYNHKLSIKLSIPSPITGVLEAYQDSVSIPFQIVNDSIFFNAVPDGGQIRFDVVKCTQPSDSITVIGSTTFCTPDSVIIEADYNANYNYTWFKNGSAFGADTNKITVLESGEYYTIVTLDGCPNYSTKTTVTVTGICGVPEADFKVDLMRQFLNEEVIYTSNSTNLSGGETFYWDFGTGASVSPGLHGSGPIKVAYSIPGLKTVSLTATGSVASNVETKKKYVDIDSKGGCGIFKEDFNDDYDLKFFDCWCNYSTSIVNDAFRITTSDSLANQWYSVSWLFNDKINFTSIDFGDLLYKPVLKIRAKASDTARVAFGIGDTSYTATAGHTLNKISYVDLTTEYQVFEVDFSNSFYYEWSSTPAPVDSTQIKYLEMTINQGWKSNPITNSFGQLINKQFAGHVDIDWISIGEKCEVDSLIANIVLPNKVCVNQSFNVWNHSNPKLTGAQLDWTFDKEPTSFDASINDELPIKLSYSEAGTKTITLKVTTAEGKEVTVVEDILVENCALGVNDVENQNLMSFVNPINSSLNGTIDSKIDQSASIALTDINGKVMLLDKIHLYRGFNEIHYENLDLPNGMHIFTVYTVTGTYQIKLISIGK